MKTPPLRTTNRWSALSVDTLPEKEDLESSNSPDSSGRSYICEMCKCTYTPKDTERPAVALSSAEDTQRKDKEKVTQIHESSISITTEQLTPSVPSVLKKSKKATKDLKDTSYAKPFSSQWVLQ